MKNARSKFAQVMAQQYNSEYRLLLTGTPLQNNLQELWSLLYFLNPVVFQSCIDFEEWFSSPFGCSNNASDKEKQDQLSEEEQLLLIRRLHQVLEPFLLRRIKKEVESELPNKIEHVIKVELTPIQKIIYHQIYNETQKNKQASAKSINNWMMQVRKICNHPYLFYDYDEPVNDMIWRTSGKFELLDRILLKLLRFKHRILVFTQMTSLLDIMQQYLDYIKIKYLRLDGQTSADKRELYTTQFNSYKCDVDIFLLSTRAGGLGLNLQSADTVIIFDSDWNPQMDLQAQDRAHRIGQKNEVRVLRLVTNTNFEQEILNRAAYKIGLDQKIIQAGMYNQRSTEKERQDRIRQILQMQHHTEDLDEEVPNDEQINELLARSQEELETFQEMDQERYQREKHIYKNFALQSEESNEEEPKKYVNYRFIREDEIPDEIKNPETLVNDEKQYGRGNRERKEVNYSDDLTDLQFMKLIDEGKDVQKYLLNKKKKREQKIGSNFRGVSSNRLDESSTQQDDSEEKEGEQDQEQDKEQEEDQEQSINSSEQKNGFQGKSQSDSSSEIAERSLKNKNKVDLEVDERYLRRIKRSKLNKNSNISMIVEEDENEEMESGNQNEAKQTQMQLRRRGRPSTKKHEIVEEQIDLTEQRNLRGLKKNKNRIEDEEEENEFGQEEYQELPPNKKSNINNIDASKSNSNLLAEEEEHEEGENQVTVKLNLNGNSFKCNLTKNGQRIKRPNQIIDEDEEEDGDGDGDAINKIINGGNNNNIAGGNGSNGSNNNNITGSNNNIINGGNGGNNNITNGSNGINNNIINSGNNNIINGGNNNKGIVNNSIINGGNNNKGIVNNNGDDGQGIAVEDEEQEQEVQELNQIANKNVNGNGVLSKSKEKSKIIDEQSGKKDHSQKQVEEEVYDEESEYQDGDNDNYEEDDADDEDYKG